MIGIFEMASSGLALLIPLHTRGAVTVRLDVDIVPAFC